MDKMTVILNQVKYKIYLLIIVNFSYIIDKVSKITSHSVLIT